MLEISGKPTRKVVFSPGGVTTKIDPNGTYLTGGMYAQYKIPSFQRGAAPLLMWHGGGLTGVCWETTPDGRVCVIGDTTCLVFDIPPAP